MTETLIWHITRAITHQAISNWASSEEGENRSDYALLIAFVVVFVLALLFVMGPQVAIIYAQAASSR